MKIIIFLFCLLIPLQVSAQSNANPEDVRQAKQFLTDIPPACRDSNMYIRSDGTVVVRVLCEPNSKSQGMDGIIEMKDGRVIKIK